MKPAQILFGWAEFLQPYWNEDADKVKIGKLLQRPMKTIEPKYLVLIHKHVEKWIKVMLSDYDYWTPVFGFVDGNAYTLAVDRGRADTEVKIPLVKLLQILEKSPLSKMCSFQFSLSDFHKRMREISAASRKAITAWIEGDFTNQNLYVWLQGNDNRIEGLYENYGDNINDPRGWDAQKSGKSQYEAEVHSSRVDGTNVIFDMALHIFGWEAVRKQGSVTEAQAARVVQRYIARLTAK
jgi:hypothetical protein